MQAHSWTACLSTALKDATAPAKLGFEQTDHSHLHPSQSCCSFVVLRSELLCTKVSVPQPLLLYRAQCTIHGTTLPAQHMCPPKQSPSSRHCSWPQRWQQWPLDAAAGPCPCSAFLPAPCWAPGWTPPSWCRGPTSPGLQRSPSR